MTLDHSFLVRRRSGCGIYRSTKFIAHAWHQQMLRRPHWSQILFRIEDAQHASTVACEHFWSRFGLATVKLRHARLLNLCLSIPLSESIELLFIRLSVTIEKRDNRHKIEAGIESWVVVQSWVIGGGESARTHGYGV
jgi:hypothetical protein